MLCADRLIANSPAIKGGCVAEPKALTEAKQASGVPAIGERLKITLWRTERQ